MRFSSVSSSHSATCSRSESVTRSAAIVACIEDPYIHFATYADASPMSMNDSGAVRQRRERMSRAWARRAGYPAKSRMDTVS